MGTPIGVKPNVRAAAIEVEKRYGTMTILGLGFRPNASDHPKGLALDFMTGKDTAKGNAIAAFMMANAATFGVTYIIWQQKIWKVSNPVWEQMEDRGSVTANHFDHVHVSFRLLGTGYSFSIDPADVILPGPIPNARPDQLPPGIGGGLGDTFADIRNALASISKAAAWMTDARNWLRVGMFTLGGLLIILALVMTVTNGKPKAALKAASNIIKPGVKK